MRGKSLCDGDLRGDGSMSRCGCMQSGDGNLLESTEGRWLGLQRWQRLHPIRYLSGWRLHGLKSGCMRSHGPMSRCWKLRSSNRRLFQSRQGRWLGLQRWQRLHPIGYLSGRRLHGLKPGCMRSHGSMSRCWKLRSSDGRLFQSRQGRWHRVQRWQRLHQRRSVYGGGLCSRDNHQLRRQQSLHRRLM